MKRRKIIGVIGEVPVVAMLNISIDDGYFSTTGYIARMNSNGNISRKVADRICEGAIGDQVKHFTHAYDDVIDLHLSNLDGEPMYAVENGWYFTHEGDVKKLANHLRITEKEAKKIIDVCKNKSEFESLVESMKPRWKQEADKALRKYKLK